MPYNLAALLADVAFKLQNNPRYLTPQAGQTMSPAQIGLNRAQQKIYEYCLEGDDIWITLNPLQVQPDPNDDPTDPSSNNQYAEEIPLPVGTLYVSGVLFQKKQLLPLTEQQWQATRGTVDLNFGFPDSYYVRGNKYLCLYPRPQVQHQLQVFGLFSPPQLVLPTDVPSINPRFSDAMVAYATFWCLDGQTGEGERASSQYQLYLTARAEAKFNATQSTETTIKRRR